MRRGAKAPIAIGDLIEVTEASLAVEEALRTRRMVSVKVTGCEVAPGDRA
jgi:hypothetical protein